MMFGKILLKILMVSAWLSLAFGSSQSNEFEKLKKQVKRQGGMFKTLEIQNQDIVKLIDRLHPPTSCSALLIKHPSTPSGMYYINHQGLSSSPLVQVYCDMTSKNGVGVTVIGHDSGSRTLVKGYESRGSYKRKIKYDISMEQIFAIMKQSTYCEQFIKYECHGSVLLYTTTPYAWWVSRQGSQMKYWGGAAVNSGKCACGMTNSCAKSGKKCNCDKNDYTWREDSGYLTDKNTLPVTELRFGDTGDSREKGYYTLGKLRCWDIARLHPPASCSALLIKHPSTPSGMYYINPQGLGSSPLVQVYCNMTSENGVGVTVIGHDSGSRTLVKGYESAGSYKQKIKYDISMEQIVAIMKQSKNCKQFIKYECYHSGMWFSTPYGWWVSRQGSQMKYWGGAAVNSGKCACGMTNSCAGGKKCNCDKNDNTWREDSGYLTDKNTLPVTELRFGDTGGTGEKGYHTLEKLRCWG